MKLRHLSILLLFPLIFVGCDSLFDEGDVEATYDGPNQVAFFPLETNTADGAGTATIDVQLITSSSSGASSDITINFTPSGTAVSGTHFTIASNSVTIPAGDFSATITVNLIADSVPAGGEVQLVLTMDDATGGAQLAANLDEANVFIAD